jgi:hypothetical protein
MKKPTFTAAPPQSFAEIREAIREIQAEIAETVSAPLPFDMLAQAVRDELRRHLAPHADFVARLTNAFGSTSTGLNVFPVHTDSIAPLALSMALEPQLDRLVKCAERLAKESEPNGALRLSPIEKATRLADLRAQLYELELLEEAATPAGTPRRDDVNPGAVLGVPLDVAQAHRFFAEVA